MDPTCPICDEDSETHYTLLMSVHSHNDYKGRRNGLANYVL